MTRAFFGHPKCAGTWFSGYFLSLCTRLGLKYRYEQIVLIEEHLEEIKEKDKVDMFVSQNSSYSKAKELQDMRAIHVIRDPRDITVSAYYSYKNTHQIGSWTQLATLRKKLNQCDLDEGLKHIMEFNRVDIERMAEWDYDDPMFMNVKLENFMKDQRSSTIECIEFLGLLDEEKSNPDVFYYPLAHWNRVSSKLNLSLQVRQSAVSVNQADKLFEKLQYSKLAKGRIPGEEKKDHHYRKGVAGDWKNYFKPEHKTMFIDLYGDVLQKLGYENSNDWT